MKKNPAAPIQLSPVQKAICLIWLNQQNPDPKQVLFQGLSKHEQETCLVAFDRLWERYQGGAASDLAVLLERLPNTREFFACVWGMTEELVQWPWVFDYVVLVLLRNALERGMYRFVNIPGWEGTADIVGHANKICVWAHASYTRSQKKGSPRSLDHFITAERCYSAQVGPDGPIVMPLRYRVWDDFLGGLFCCTYPTAPYAQAINPTFIGLWVGAHRELEDRGELPATLPLDPLLQRAEATITQEILRLCPK